MEMRERGITTYKGLTFSGRGAAVRKGRGLRALALLGDQIEFTIAEDREGPPLLSKSTGLGVEQGDNGVFTVTIPGTELTRSQFPNRRYYYTIKLTEGDTGESYLLGHGAFILESMPFA